MKRIILVQFVFIFFPGLYAQINEDNMTLSLVKEPLTLHKGRFKASLSYKYTYLSHYFDDNGIAINSIDHGSIGHMNFYKMDLKYGLTNHIQLRMRLDHSTGVESYKSYSKLMGNEQPAVNFCRIKKIQGPGGLSFELNLKFPISQENFELSVFPAINISPGSSDPRKTELEIHNIRDDFLNVLFTEYEKSKHGFVNLGLGIASKFRFSEKLAVQGSAFYQSSLNNVDTYKWDEKYNLDEYYFTKSKLTYEDLIVYDTELSLFIVPDKKEIIGINLGVIYQNSQFRYNIHDSETTITEVSNSLTAFGLINLILSRNLRYSQVIEVDVLGKNHRAGFSFLSTFSFQILCK